MALNLCDRNFSQRTVESEWVSEWVSVPVVVYSESLNNIKENHPPTSFPLSNLSFVLWLTVTTLSQRFDHGIKRVKYLCFLFFAQIDFCSRLFCVFVVCKSTLDFKGKSWWCTHFRARIQSDLRLGALVPSRLCAK